MSSSLPNISDEGKTCYGLCYVVNRKQFNIKSRDFYDKFIQFYHKGRFYRYATGTPNSLELRPLHTEDTIRGDTLLGVGMIYRNAEEKIRQVQLCQVDMKMEVPQWLLSQFLPKACKAWLENL